MNVYDAVKKRRTIRKFRQDAVRDEAITKMIDSARLAPCGANMQPLKFAVIKDESVRRELYPLIKYAGYLSWDPSFEECPPVFIAVLADTGIKPAQNTECDCGAAVMSMCLVAQELGLSTCWLGAIDRAAIKKTLGLEDKFEVKYLLGAGYGAQTGDVFDICGDVKYRFDESGNVHVPKRTMDEILVDTRK